MFARALVVSSLSLAVAAPLFAASPIVTTFNAGPDGFVAGTTSTTQIHLASGGNPGGFIEIRKTTGPTAFDISTANTTTAAFLGDYAAAGITGAGFDLNVFNTSVQGALLRFRQNSSTNGWVFNFGAVAPSGNSWNSFNVNFNPTWTDAQALANGWTQEPLTPSFAALFASVGEIEVRIITPPTQSTLVGIDNVRLIPAPGVTALLGAGALLLARRRR